MVPLAEVGDRGGPVLGICNGVQMAKGTALPPVVLDRNHTPLFHRRWEEIRIDGRLIPSTRGVAWRYALRLPVAPGEGTYGANDATPDRPDTDARTIARHVHRSNIAHSTISRNADGTGLPPGGRSCATERNGQQIGADSIGYLSRPGLLCGIGAPETGFSTGCPTGHHPRPVKLGLDEHPLERI